MSLVTRVFFDHGVDLPIDFDHCSFSEPGTRRDTAGWIGSLEARDDGLWATNIRWTEKGLAAISPGVAPDGTPTLPEYRYFSPAIQFDPETRRITRLEPVALVTFPASKHQPPLVMSATAPDSAAPSPSATWLLPMPLDPRGPLAAPTEFRPMKSVLTALSLSESASEVETLSAVSSLRSERDELLRALGSTTLSAALGALDGYKTAVARLASLETENARLRGASDAQRRDALLTRGRADKKLTRAQAEFFRTQPVEVLDGFLKTAPVIASLAASAEVPAEPAPGLAGRAITDAYGRSLEQLTATERAELSQREPEMYRAMRESWLARDTRVAAVLAPRLPPVSE